MDEGVHFKPFGASLDHVPCCFPTVRGGAPNKHEAAIAQHHTQNGEQVKHSLACPSEQQRW